MTTLIVGTGIAGLTAALAHPHPEQVVLLTKADPTASNTYAAQGGIAAVTRPPAPGDSVAAHVADTLTAGAGHCDPVAVRALCGDGPDRIADLIAADVPFDRTTDGGLCYGLEAAHSVARILHAGGDTTGAAIAVALLAAATEAGVRISSHTLVTELFLDGGRVRGARVLTQGRYQDFAADAVVLATGGAGQLYPFTSNPAVATGDGLAVAARAGAALADLEFYQFHPTTLARPGNFLISEAVRGEGAVLIDGTGARFLTDIHPDAELAPRDVVARAIADHMRTTGRPVYLDATALGRDRLAARFPSIDAAVRAAGVDWATDPVPVTPAAHYWMGGVCTDLVGRTSVPGLYAAGEVARTGVHGANRLASNSLLEGAVFGRRAALAIGQGGHPDLDTSLDQNIELAAAIPAVPRAQVQDLMWGAVGLGRDGGELETAEHTLGSWAQPGQPEPTVTAHEDANLLLLARLTARAARRRTHSIGAHLRTDGVSVSELEPV